MKTLLLPAALLLFAGKLHAAEICIDFDDFTPGTNLPVGSATEIERVGVSIAPHRDANGQPVPGGSAGIVTFPSGSGNRALSLSNATVCFDFACASEVSFQWANQGGTIRLMVDGDTLQLAGLANGSHTVGGATVTITTSGPGGTVTITPNPSSIRHVCIGGQELIIDNVCHTPCPDNPQCLDFEDVEKPLDTGDSFTEDGIEIQVIPFLGGSGTASPGANNLAGHYNNELLLANAGIAFDRDCAAAASFDFFQGDDGIEITINGETVVVNEMKDLDGTTLGGVEISVVFPPDRKGAGTASLDGRFHSFAVGGSELAIDHFCAQPCGRDCIDFEEETLGTTYQSGEFFTEDNIQLVIGKYTPGSGSGTGEITDDQRAGHLGQEILLREASLVLHGAPCIATLQLHYGQSDLGIEININGQVVTAPTMAALDGQTIGGALLEVAQEPVTYGVRGVLTATGTIDEFSLGGTILHLDHICLTLCESPDCIGFEGFPWQSNHTEGDELVEDGLTMTVRKLTPLPAAPDPLVTITSDHAANHFGQEARLNDARLDILFPCASTVTFRAFQHASGFRVRINDVAAIGNNLDELDGNTVGGAAISVSDGGNGSKLVQITGTILKLGIGGVDLSIDHLCHIPCTPPAAATCTGFETLPLAQSWSTESFPFDFTQDDLTFEAQFIQDLGGNLVTGGSLSASTAGKAGHLGRELALDNHGVSVDFGFSSVDKLRIPYGNYGSFIYLFINGETVTAADFLSLDGTQIGGVTVSVTRVIVPGGHTGILDLSGEIQNFNFIIGGGNLYLDHLCFEEFTAPPVPFTLGRLFVFQGAPECPEVPAAGPGELALRLEVTGSPTLTLFASPDLGETEPWAPVPGATFVPVCGQPGLRQAIVPMTAPRMFYRVAASE